MNKSLAFFLLSGLFLLQACTGEMFLEKSMDFKEDHQGKVRKIVLLEPDIVVAKSSDAKGTRISLTGKKELQFNELLQNNASLCGIETELIDANDLSETDLDYFNYLLPLKEQIYLANVNQDVTHEKKKRSKSLTNLKYPAENSFKDNPRILTEYSWLSNKYGTPYFGVYGVYSSIELKRFSPWFILFPPWLLSLIPSVSTVFFSVLVDVESGEVIYREVRTTNNRASNETLNSFIYDSFRIISRK